MWVLIGFGLGSDWVWFGFASVSFRGVFGCVWVRIGFGMGSVWFWIAFLAVALCILYAWTVVSLWRAQGSRLC